MLDPYISWWTEAFEALSRCLHPRLSWGIVRRVVAATSKVSAVAEEQ